MKYYKLENTQSIYTHEAMKQLMTETMFNPTDGRIKSAVEGIYNKEQGRFYVAEEESEIVGILGVRRVDNTFVEIMHMAVKEKMKKKGVGRGLIDCVLNVERVEKIKVTCDEASKGFFKSCGFACKEDIDPITYAASYYCEKKWD
jgi:N-acetylglutamate synthase-like GNAT family acetyltransferase